MANNIIYRKYMEIRSDLLSCKKHHKHVRKFLYQTYKRRLLYLWAGFLIQIEHRIAKEIDNQNLELAIVITCCIFSCF